MQRSGLKRSATSKTTKTTKTTTTLKRQKTTTPKPRRTKTSTRHPFGPNSSITTTTHSTFSSKRKNDDSSSENSSSEQDQSSSENERDSEERGPLMPELYVLSLQLDQKRQSFYKDKKNQKDYLSSISQRMLDKNGLFLRASPPLLHLVPSYYDHLELDDRVMYFQKGDVEVFVAPISQPDEISRNHTMVDALLNQKKLKFKWDNVVIPLSAKPQSYTAYHNPLQKMTSKDIKYDVFDPENVPQPPKIVAGSYSVVETPQYAAYKAYEDDYDITLSGRFEFVSINNWKFKALQMPNRRQRVEVGLLIGTGADNATLLGTAPMNILPHTPNTNVITEITYNFEPALVATAAVRSTIEEQQAEYDAEMASYREALEAEGEKKEGENDQSGENGENGAQTGQNVKKTSIPPRTRRVLAFMDTAHLRHFENTYELLPAIKPQEWSYLKRGFEEWYRDSEKPTFGDMLSNSLEAFDSEDSDDSDSSTDSTSESDVDDKKKKNAKTASKSPSILSEPGIQPPRELAQTRMRRYQLLFNAKPELLAAPMVGIHRLFTAIYGPVADVNSSSCGRCQFDIDQFGLYMARCSSPTLLSKMGLMKPVKCSDPFDYHFNPEALRFPPFDSDPLLGENVTPNLFKQWMAMRHGLVKIERQEKKEGRQLFLDDILKVQNSLEQILQGNLKKFPSPKIRQSDQNWSEKGQAKADAQFLHGARVHRHDSDSESGDEDEKGQEEGDGERGEIENPIKDIKTKTKSPPKDPEDKGYSIIGKFQSLADESAQRTMQDVIKKVETELGETRKSLEASDLSPEQRQELTQRLEAGSTMLKRAKDAYTVLIGEDIDAKKEGEKKEEKKEEKKDENDENKQEKKDEKEEKQENKQEPQTFSQEFSVNMSQDPVEHLKVTKKTDFKNEFRNITEPAQAELQTQATQAAPETTTSTATAAAAAAPKYTGSNEFRRITENVDKKD